MKDWKLRYKQAKRDHKNLKQAVGGLIAALSELTNGVAGNVYEVHRALYGFADRKRPIRVKVGESLVLRWRKLQNSDRFDGLQAIVQNDMTLQPGEVDDWLGQATDAINELNREFNMLVGDTLEHVLGKKKKQS